MLWHSSPVSLWRPGLNIQFEAIDADDLRGYASLMRSAGVDAETIAIVLKKMAAPHGEH